MLWIFSSIMDKLPGRWWKPFSLSGAFLTYLVFLNLEISGFFGLLIGFLVGLISGMIFEIFTLSKHH